MNLEDPKFRIETQRLILRPPLAEDFPHFVQLMGDEETARHIGGVMTEGQVWRSFASLIGHWHLRGYGFFCVIEKQSGRWLGRVGPWNPHQWPEPEVGWTIFRPYWKQGFGREAAIASIDWAFAHLGWERVAHVIAHDNLASQGVAKSIGSKPLYEITELPAFGPIAATVWGQSKVEWQGR